MNEVGHFINNENSNDMVYLNIDEENHRFYFEYLFTPENECAL